MYYKTKGEYKMKNKKKIIALLLCLVVILVGFLSLKSKKGEIGTTYESKFGIEFTVNEISFTDVIDGWGGANDDFWKPLNETNCNIGGRYTLEQYKMKYGRTPKSEDDRIVYISYIAKNISKNDVLIDQTGYIDHDNGYTYSDGNLAYRVSDNGVWHEIPQGITLQKLAGESYEFRAYTVVPKEVVESDKPLTINLYGYTFKIR